MPRNPRELLEKKRDEYADHAYARYVKPRGQGLHIVTLLTNQVQIKVSAIVHVTFSPGDIVLIGSLSGRRGKVILGLPPAGSQGSGGFAASDYGVGDLSAPVILAAHPNTVPSGSLDYRIVLVGRSLLNNDLFRAQVWNDETSSWEDDPLVEVVDIDYNVDPEVEDLILEPDEDAVAIFVNVSADRAPGTKISFVAQRA